MGVIAALLLASGETSSFTVPLWVKVPGSGGDARDRARRVADRAKIGRRISRLRPLDSLASQTSRPR